MTRQFSLLIFSVFLAFAVNAQLSGTYTIGTGGNYTSFSAAVSALNSQGISGNVVFNVTSGTYTEQITINNFTGNATHTVTFQSAAGDSTAVTLQAASSTTSTNNFVVKFNHAKNIKFKDMTIYRSGSSDYAQVVEIASSSTYLSFNSVILKNNKTNLAGDYAALVIGKNTNNSVLNHFTFTNCKFINGSYGIFIQGSSSGSLASGLEITNSIFSNQYRTVIYAAYQESPKINYNIITSNSTYYNFHAIDFLYCNKGPEIMNNKFSLNKGYGLYLTNSQGCCSFTGKIFNNFMAMSGSGATGIFMSNSGTFNFYFNSINMYGSSSKAFRIAGSTANHNRFANNILYSATTAKLMVVEQSITMPFDYCNYNDYKTNGYIGDWHATTNISSLSAWKTTSSLDANSISVNPNFVSNTDLHIQSSQVQRAGTTTLNAPVTNIDIDGRSRHNIHPDMGAHEYSFDDLKITKVTVEDNMCLSSKYNVKITIKNISNHDFNDPNLPVKYKFNGNTVSELKPISSLASGDSLDYIFSAKITASTVGAFNVEAWFTLNMDINSSNDTAVKAVAVNDYPVITLPNDTQVCSTNTVTLDPGQGFDYYLWKTGDTTSTVTLDVTMLGMGGTFVWVEVTKSKCKSKDSTLVVFKDCSGINDKIVTEALSVYPNPATITLSIDIQGPFKPEYAEIRDLTGRVVYHESGLPAKGKIDVSGLPKGSYILLIKTDTGTARKQIIKR